MKYKIAVILAIIAGALIGLLGVIVSVFADGALAERMITIGIILVIYFVLCGVLGLIMPNYSWEWGMMTGGPGVFFLIIYMLKELNVFYMLYMVLILLFACVGGWCGSWLGRHRREQKG